MPTAIIPQKAEAAEIAQKSDEPPLRTKEDYIAYIDTRAGSFAEKVEGTISCETGGTWNPKIAGDNSTSFGLSQIHLPAHPDISKEQAEDPKFAIDYMITEIKKGHGSMWTCYRLKYL